MKFEWKPAEGRFATGERARVGRVGQLSVWYDPSRPRGESTAYAAAVFGHRCKNRFATADEAKAWCEKWGTRFLQEAMRDVGIR